MPTRKAAWRTQKRDRSVTNLRNAMRPYEPGRALHTIKMERKLIERDASPTRLARADRAANAAMIPF